MISYTFETSLQTILVKVVNTKNNKVKIILLDSGSQRSYILAKMRINEIFLDRV